jgi:hypothetical protein
LKLSVVESIQELYAFNGDAIRCLTSFVVGGHEKGNIYNVFFETGKGRYCFQTLDVGVYISARDFVNDWANKRISLLIYAINNFGDVVIGSYRLSQEGVSVNEDLFLWVDSFLIFDGVQTVLKSASTGKIFLIDNSQDFWGYIVVCFFSPSPTKEVREVRAKWMGRDLVAEQAKKQKLETELRLHVLERDYLETLFYDLLINAASEEFGLRRANERPYRKICNWDEIPDTESEEENHESVLEESSAFYSVEDELESGADDHESILDSFDIDYVFHITHYSNLSNILNRGLRAHGNNFVAKNIDNASVNRIRSKSDPVFGRSLHSYAPFYFNPKNPMLYVNKGKQNDILILAFSRNLLTRDGVLFTDGNAAKKQTNFYTDLRDLNKLNWDCLRADFWNSFENGKSHRMAELLVYKMVSVKNLVKIFCFDEETLEFVLSTDKSLDVDVKRDFYF